MERNNIILTTMTMVYDHNGNILVQNRLKNDWPGINFPGGHVEINESIVESAIREFKEETNLDIYDLHCSGYYEWNMVSDEYRHLCILFKTDKYSGTIKPSSEGEIFFINIDDIDKYPQSTDFKEVLEVLLNN